ncbi:MAG TPA: hypothetical protein VGE39_00510 [Prosthecobacter sp.]
MSTRRSKQPRSVPPQAWPVTDECAEVSVEITPGKTVMVRLPKQVPQYALFGVVPDGNGGYKIAPAFWSQYLPMGRRVTSQLGIPIHRQTLRRLVLMGAVGACLPTPGTILVDAASLLQHLRRTRIQPGKARWWTPERIKLWRESQLSSVESILDDAE